MLETFGSICAIIAIFNKIYAYRTTFLYIVTFYIKNYQNALHMRFTCKPVLVYLGSITVGNS